MERTICTIARRMAMTLLLAVTVATAQAQNTLVSHIDCCKAGVCSIYIAGWVYDSDQNTKWDWWLGHGINVFAFVSTDPNETYQGYFPIPHDDMEYIVRTDVNEAYGLCNEHGFRTMISLNPYLYLFQDDEGDISEQTFYVKIYLKANFGNGSQNFLRHSFAVTVRRNFGDGSEENPYIISDVGDWNDIIRAMNDDDMGGYYNGSHYRMDEYFDDTTPVTTMFGTAARPFTGTFDGNGKTLNVNLGGALHVAPFAYTNGATIKNLTVAGSINATQYAGGIVGYAAGTLTLRNCACSATISGFQNYAGGLLGWCDDLTLNISDCLFSGVFSPANGGLYHPIALKDSTKTVTVPPTITVYHVNTAAPSEGLGNDLVGMASGVPVSTTLVDGVWDEPIVAADGQTYYAAHFNGKHLPYEYGFGPPLVEEGWTMVDNVGNTGIWGLTNYSRRFHFKYQGSLPQYLISPEFDGKSGINVTFCYKQYYAAYPVTFQVGYSTTTRDIEAFIWDYTITTTNTQWILYTGYFPKGTKYIAVKWYPKWGTVQGSDLELDDFSFTVSNAPAPLHLNVNDITDHTALPTWEAPEAEKPIMGYTCQWKKESDAEWSAETTVTTTSVTLSGLTDDTNYQFRVKTLYADETSIYVSANFTTAREYPYHLPYTYNFETPLNEDKWTMADNYDDTGLYEHNHSHSGGYVFLFEVGSKSTRHTQYLISPAFDGYSGIKVTFYYSQYFYPTPATFQVGYSTTTPDIEAFIWDDKITTTDTTFTNDRQWHLYEGVYPKGTKYIAVKMHPNQGSALLIDDFSFTACDTPSPTHLAADDVTEYTASPTWEAPETDRTITGYIYQYKKNSDAEWSAETTVTTTSATLTGLTADTDYQFRVKALYGNDESIYSSISFTTAIELPYDYGFEDGFGHWTETDCYIYETEPIYTEDYTGICSENHHNGEYAFAFCPWIDPPQYLISPRLSGESPIMLSFYYKKGLYEIGDGLSYAAKFQVGYSQTTTDISAFTWSTDIYGNRDWTRALYTFPIGTRYIAIKWLPKSYYLYLDDFCIKSYAADISLADNGDNTTAISTNNGKDAVVTLQDRTFHRDGLWHTLCLPFDVSNFTDTPFAEATVKTLGSTAFSNGTLTLNFKDANSIEAGKPYIVNWKKAAYLTINSTEDWNAFAESVNNGNTYAGKTVLLGTNINVSTMVGTAEHPFCGTFEGAAKRLNLSISNGGDGAAPFHYIRGATIRNVQTIGNVSGGNYVSGLVGIATGGTNTIHNCMVEATVTGDSHAGGILGHGTTSSTTIHDCKVNGALTASNIGIIYGWGNAGGTHTIERCVGAGSYNSGQSVDMMLTDGGTCTVTNCASNIDIVLVNTEAPLYSAELGDQWRLDENGKLALKISILAFNRANIENPVFYGVTISDAVVPAETQYADFIGCTSPVAFTANDPSVIYLDDITLQSPSANMTLGSCRAYFHIKDPTLNVQNYVLNFLEKGDINGDGQVTIADVPGLVNLVLSGSNDPIGDINGDGRMTLADVTALVNRVK